MLTAYQNHKGADTAAVTSPPTPIEPLRKRNSFIEHLSNKSSPRTKATLSPPQITTMLNTNGTEDKNAPPPLPPLDLAGEGDKPHSEKLSTKVKASSGDNKVKAKK